MSGILHLRSAQAAQQITFLTHSLQSGRGQSALAAPPPLQSSTKSVCLTLHSTPLQTDGLGLHCDARYFLHAADVRLSDAQTRRKERVSSAIAQSLLPPQTDRQAGRDAEAAAAAALRLGARAGVHVRVRPGEGEAEGEGRERGRRRRARRARRARRTWRS